MKNKYQALIKHLRLKEGVSQELLAKKIGTNKSNISKIENGLQGLIVDDLEAALNYLGAKILIVDEDGEDLMEIMQHHLLVEDMVPNNTGYSKDFIDKNGNPIMVDFNLFVYGAFIPRDMFDTDQYISSKKYYSYEKKHSNDIGYGIFEEIYDSCYMWDSIFEYSIETDDLELYDVGSELFDEGTLKKIKETLHKLHNSPLNTYNSILED